MRKFLCLCMAMVMLISVAMPVASVAQTVSYPEVTALQNDEGTFISMDNDAFQDIVFNKIPEEQQQQAHNAFADDLHMIRIRTKSGLQFYVSYYPNYGFLYSGHAMAYHQVTPELAIWFQEYELIDYSYCK